MCDTLVSLTDGGVVFAKNSDRDPNEAQVVTWLPAADHPEGGEVRCTWIAIPQVARTHAVVLSRPWWMWGAEVGANEHGVVIGNEAVFTDQPLGEPALLGMDLLRLALERAASAEAAAAVLIDLLERHGQGGPCSHEHPGFSYHNSFLVADPDGAIVVETAGREWATEVVRGRGRSISNGLSIEAFARAHAQRIRPWVAACAARRARTQPAAEAARGPADLMAALRDHGRGAVPSWSMVNGALGAPCAHAGGLVTATQSTASWVADLRGAPLHWATGTSAPCTSLFKPVRVGSPPSSDPGAADPSGPGATNRFDPSVRWWRHEVLHRRILRDHGASTARFTAERDRIEAGWLADPPSTESALDVADEAELRWLADLEAADLPDRRPRWLRRLWAAWDRDAGLPCPDASAQNLRRFCARSPEGTAHG
jgi:dipeptidase